MEKYDGFFDPVDHLRNFVDLMRLRVTPDAIMCRTFSPTLRWKIRDWVATFPPKSICTFDDFSKQFTAYFSSNNAMKVYISCTSAVLLCTTLSNAYMAVVVATLSNNSKSSTTVLVDNDPLDEESIMLLNEESSPA
ncbi:Uncharacterized protein Adt_23875 [Abeliophyllum distichum]|uniref:Uncharacterized protein n=1 Tax=Abeliophyllum distichum TaxID=126358 RepID=A0ABD1SC36_9LAMI